MNRDEPLVLGIETSCDETGIGIVRGRTLLSNTIASSMDEHARYGGVVPEVAARAHLEALQPSIEAALAEAGVALADLDAVAVTSGPGLAGALMVGVGAAKALAVSLEHAAVRRQPPRRAHRGRHPRRRGAAARVPDGRAARQRRAHVAAPRPRPDHRRRAARRDDGRRRRRGVRQGRAAARAAVPGRSRDRPGRGIRRSDRDPLPARAVARVRHGRAPLRLLVLGAEDRRRALGRAARRTAGEPVPVADVAASFREAVVDVLVTKALAACARPRRAAPAARRRRHREPSPARRGARASGCRGRDRADSARCRSAPTTAR